MTATKKNRLNKYSGRILIIGTSNRSNVRFRIEAATVYR
jgi:hypothetical protein